MVLGGSAGGGELGRLVGGYGLLLMLAGLYLVGALALRERHSRRQMRRGPSVASPTELHVRRIF